VTILTRRARAQETNIWPGFVDALAALLMVIIFVLMIFIVAQFYLTQQLSGRDNDLARLQGQILALGELLSLERTTNSELTSTISSLNEGLKTATQEQEILKSQISELIIFNNSLNEKVNALTSERKTLRLSINKANASISFTKAELSASLNQLRNLQTQLEEKTKESDLSHQKLEKTHRLNDLMQKDLNEAKDLLSTLILRLSTEKLQLVTLKESNKKLRENHIASNSLLNMQMLALRRELLSLNELIKKSEIESQLKSVKIVDLGKRLNRALASKVQELAKFRSEFFGQLQAVLKNRQDIRTVGDRFVFQSEVLFESGHSDIANDGEKELLKLAKTLNKIAPKIPKHINWILQIEGHTDHIPISNIRFQSNWDLSAARAISVVEFLIKQGVAAHRLSAAGYGEFQPMDKRRDEISNRRNRRIEMKLTQR
jgi:chemotaxis protein MotB